MDREFMLLDSSYLSQIVDMRIQYMEEDYHGLTSTQLVKMQQQLPLYFQKHLNHDVFVFACVIDHKVVSTAMLQVIEKPSNPSLLAGLVGEVLNVYTCKEYRHQGIAKRLMMDMIDYARKHQLDYINLSATDEGYPLYEKLGFKEHHSKYHPMRYRFTL